PRILVEAEQQILRAPHILHGPRIDVDAAGAARLAAEPEPASPAGVSAPADPDGDFFSGYLRARTELFGHLVLPETRDEASDVLVVEGADPRELRAPAEAYAEAYLTAVTACLRALDRPNATHADRWRTRLHRLLRTDTLTVRLHDTDDSRRTVVLVAPTHPLRMLWWSGQAALADHWLAQLHDAPTVVVKTRLDSLERQLAPLG